MIEIGKTDFLIDVPSLKRGHFKRYSSELFDSWESYIASSLKLSDYSVVLELEEGSVKGKGKIYTRAAILLAGIGAYGEIVSGLQTIQSQACYVGNRLIERAAVPFGGERAPITSRNSGSTLGRLNGLFQRVQRQELLPEEAMLEAERLLGEEGDSCGELMSALRQGFERTPRNPNQLPLLDEDFEGSALEVPSDGKRKPVRRLPPTPVIPSNEYRVEISRKSKKARKIVKVTKL